MTTALSSTSRDSSTARDAALAELGRVLCEHRDTAGAAGPVLTEHPTALLDVEVGEDF